MKGKINNYQMILVFAPKSGSEIVDAVVSKVEKFLSPLKAEIKSKESLGTKELVYEIGDHRKGDFWELKLESVNPVKVTDINIFLNRETSVIRYLILKI